MKGKYVRGGEDMNKADKHCKKDIEKVIHALSLKILDIMPDFDNYNATQLSSIIKALADLVSAKALYDDVKHC